MKWTTVTFTIGFLAIAGIPPLSGFWAKGDVLDNTWAHYKPLWVIGVITAVLTAYYMSRLEILAFGGEERFDKPGPARASRRCTRRTSRPGSCASRWSSSPSSPSSPALSTCPGCTPRTSEFLAPVFAGTLYNDNLGAGPEWYLAVIDIAAAFIGVIVAYMLWRGAEVDKPALEPAFLQRVWYWDDFYDAVIGRPSQRLATFCAWVVDARIIDGAVNGTAHLAKITGTAARGCRRATSATTRSGIALGLALIVAFMLSRTWWG